MFLQHSNASQIDRQHIDRAIELALEAEQKGNLPIGAVITLGDKVVAEGQNQLLVPKYNPGGHAEIDAISKVDAKLWTRAAEMSCYSTLEPCIMCTGTLLLHGLRRVVFGALDENGGGRFILENLPPYYENSNLEWIGPLAQKRCAPLYDRALSLFSELPCGQA